MIFIKRKNSVRGICIAAMIAALYVVLTYVSAIFGLSSGVIQLRLSEAMCVLPAFTPYAIVGLSIGCLISNLLFGGIIWDVIFGTLATLLGAVGSYYVGKRSKYLALIPPIVSNCIIIPLVLCYGYGAEESLIFMFVTVGIGEVLSCGVLGAVFAKVLRRFGNIF